MNGLGGNCGCCEQSSDGSTTRTGDDDLDGGGTGCSNDDASDAGGVRGLSGGDEDEDEDDASDDASDDGGAGAGAGAGAGVGLSEAVDDPTITNVFFGSTVIVFVNCFLKFVCWLDTSIVITVVPGVSAVNKYCCV